MMLDINPEGGSHGTKGGFSVLYKGACRDLQQGLLTPENKLLTIVYRRGPHLSLWLPYLVNQCL